MEKTEVNIVVADGAKQPEYETEGSACVDILANETVVVPSGTSHLVATGLKMEIPVGYVGKLRGRSGLASKGYIVNTGVIDSDYRGEVKVMFWNTTNDDFIVHKGDRIAQFELQKQHQIVFQNVNALSNTDRNEGGFGSTGV